MRLNHFAQTQVWAAFCVGETQGCILASFVSYGVLHHFILPFSLFINSPLPNVISKTIPTPLSSSWQTKWPRETSHPSNFIKTPLSLFNYITSQSKSYKYPLSFSLSSFTSLLLLCFLQPTEEPPRESSFSCFLPHQTSPSSTSNTL